MAYWRLPRSVDALPEEQIQGKRIFLRVDFNVPLVDGVINDDQRIVRAVPMIRALLERGGKLILASHLGQPDPAEFSAELSLNVCAQRLSDLLQRKVPLVPALSESLALRNLGPQAWQNAAFEALHSAIDAPGDILLWENLRFHAGERCNDPAFAGRLAGLVDLYCHEAFASAYNEHASLIALPTLLHAGGKPCRAGRLLLDELTALHQLLHNPPQPFVVVLGGAKVKTKAPTIAHLLERANDVLVGGALAYPFLVAHGIPVGGSKYDPQDVAPAARLLEQARRLRKPLRLPVDHWAVADPNRSEPPTLQAGGIAEGLCGIDIGPQTAQQFAELIRRAQAVFWNGPLGLFETPPFDRGTRVIAEAVATTANTSGPTSAARMAVVGGGETASAVKKFGLLARMSHVSTGGGAALHLLARLPSRSVDLLDH